MQQGERMQRLGRKLWHRGQQQQPQQHLYIFFFCVCVSVSLYICLCTSLHPSRPMSQQSIMRTLTKGSDEAREAQRTVSHLRQGIVRTINNEMKRNAKETMDRGCCCCCGCGCGCGCCCCCCCCCCWFCWFCGFCWFCWFCWPLRR